jgi:DNA-binding NarL/FixJ family response regulator
MRRHTVILAEDNEDVRQKLEQILAGDYDVLAAVENGAQLVDVATTLKPDLLVIDISMPILNGLDALQQLRLRAIDAKAVIISVNADPAYVRRAFQIGATGYVLKVTGAQDLPIALRSALEGKTFVSASIKQKS